MERERRSTVDGSIRAWKALLDSRNTVAWRVTSHFLTYGSPPAGFRPEEAAASAAAASGGLLPFGVRCVTKCRRSSACVEKKNTFNIEVLFVSYEVTPLIP